MRELLETMDEWLRPTIVDRHVSLDGARKYVLRLHDGGLVETVGIPHGDADAPSRLTVCYSTQVGCAMGCAFCATGRQGLSRNLSAGEMLWQLALVERDFGCAVASAIAMGQGEPLANYGALAEALRVRGRAEGFGIGPHDLIVSTCGLTEGIRALAADGVPATLAVSLHAATQELRDALMPGVRHHPLDRLHDELAQYNRVTGKHVVVQYLMLDGVNDADEDLEALVAFCEGLDVCVTLLRFNAVEGIPFAPCTYGKMALWCLALRQRGVEASINKPRGADVSAACGQLANRYVS